MHITDGWWFSCFSRVRECITWSDCKYTKISSCDYILHLFSIVFLSLMLKKLFNFHFSYNIVSLQEILLKLKPWWQYVFVPQIIKPPLDNVCAMLRVLITLDSNPTRLSEQSITTLGNFLPEYLINVMHVSVFLVQHIFFFCLQASYITCEAHSYFTFLPFDTVLSWRWGWLGPHPFKDTLLSVTLLFFVR